MGAGGIAAGTPGRQRAGDPQLPHGEARDRYELCWGEEGTTSGTGAKEGRGVLSVLACLVTSILLRQYASLMDASLAQALEMVH